MKNQSVKVFDISDNEFADTLMGFGLKRNVAKTLTFLRNGDKVTSRDIEIASNLRQPEVSTAMRELDNLNWVIIKEVKKPGKGRPFKTYQLDKSINTIIDHLGKQKVMESRTILENIQKLKQMNVSKK
ncbi:MAG: ArsR family transcriptional regulator [Methanosarcinales archaeon]|jgi:predicted transcriptional regulator|nr:MAG: putative transcriptional regulator [ANME-2 cluster archaeon]KAF5419177.1 MAG: putative transcriptional regulator [ANME-2 cluster archaeon]MCD4842244.1 ArsR family transcriptional regulator [Methanosarcinales archaeon]MRG78006.1 ArsR family transcriptional regulator [ANME-2 cluster archaeon]NOR59366.1 ArsR family transcriptional regulator [Methanosarcinales archaeon]